jgi:hypothetical protein
MTPDAINDVSRRKKRGFAKSGSDAAFAAWSDIAGNVLQTI